MTDRVITAEALITAKDGTGDVFSRIAAKLQGVGKGARASVEIEKMAAALQTAQSQMRALDKFESTRKGFSDARAKFNAQKVAVEQAARALAAAAKPTRELEAAYRRTQDAVVRASSAFEKSKTAMLDAKHAAEGFGAPLGRIAAEQARLKGVIDQTTHAIERQGAAELRTAEDAKKAARKHRALEHAQEQRTHGIAHHGIVNYAAGAAAAAVSAHGIVHVGETAIESGAELQHERIASLNAGRTPKELEDYETAARRTAIARPTASYTESMKTLLETTSAFGSVEHAIDHLDFMMRTSAVLKASSEGKIQDSAGEMGQKFAKFFEMRGVANDPKRFEAEGNEMVRAMAATGGTFNPVEMFMFAQQAKGALRNYDLRYLSRVVPSLVGEQGGDKAGTAANAFANVIMGKARDAKQAAEWMKYGLLDPKQVDMKNGKAISWRAGAVKNTDVALRNPLEWFEGTVLPAMRAKGVKVDDTMELSKVLATMFRNQNSNQFANENAQLADRTRLHKDAALYDKTADPEQMYKRNLAEDPTQALTALSASFNSLTAAVTQPAMKDAAGIISGLAGAFAQLAGAAKDHPIAAMAAGAGTGVGTLGGAGYMSYQLMNGFGLGGAATALDGSAAALTNAAAALTGAAGKQGVAGALGSAAGRGAGILGLGTVPSVALLGGALLGTDAALMYGAHAMFAPGFKGSRYGGRQNGPNDEAWREAGGHWEQDPGRNKGYTRHWVPFAEPHPALAPPGAAHSAGLPSGPITAVVDKPVDVTGKVTAEVKGQATVAVTVKVDGPGKMAGQYATSSGNIKVSTGTTMPGTQTGTGTLGAGK